MKICIVATGYPRWSGDLTAIFVHRLAKSLAGLNEVHVVCPHADGLAKEEVMDRVCVHRFQYFYPSSHQTLAYLPGIPENIRKPLNKAKMLPFVASMAKMMLGIVKKYDLDLINAHWAFPSGLLAVLTKRIHRLPVLITLYGAEIFTLRGAYAGLRPLLAYAIRNSDKAVAISDATKILAEEVSGGRAVKILPDVIDTEYFSPLNNGNEVREKYNLHNWNVIFTCGRMVERKGFRYLLEAMPPVAAEFNNTKLIIAGDGPERPALENLSKELGIERHVIFPGFVSAEDLPKFYAACDVFVLPSIVDKYGDTEGSGTILLEAMATGKPVIGSKVGGIPFALRHGGGLLVNQKDPLALADKIRLLLGNDDMRHRLGTEGIGIVEKEFSCSTIAGRYQDEFETLIGEKQ
jgi:glycosyltransferase involved in cell wall biosynthesis